MVAGYLANVERQHRFIKPPMPEGSRPGQTLLESGRVSPLETIANEEMPVRYH